MSEPIKPIMTVAEFGGLVSLPPKGIYALITAKKLPGVLRFGRSIRILVSEALGQSTSVASPSEVSGRLEGDTQ
jgi:hypothetical protein